MPTTTDVDLPKILEGKTHIWEQNAVKLLNAWAFLKYCGTCARAPPKDYSYANNVL